MNEQTNQRNITIEGLKSEIILNEKEKLNKLDEKENILKELKDDEKILKISRTISIVSLIPFFIGIVIYEVGLVLPSTLIVLGGFFGGFGLIQLIIRVDNIPKLKKKLSKCSDRLSIIETNLDLLNSKLDYVVNDKNNQLTKLILDFSNELDKDGNDTIDVIQHDNEFMKILKSNQKEILEMEKSENRDFTKQFVKLSNFLIEKERNLQGFFKRISDITELERFDTFKTNLIEQIQFYNVLRLNSLQMISSFVENDRITFYVIYEKFDKLGVWNTNFENQFLSKMDLLNSNINSLISEISDMSYTINNSINELISITEENTSTLTDKLGEIGSKIDVSNMLNTINTYQNYKTNKKLK